VLFLEELQELGLLADLFPLHLTDVGCGNGKQFSLATLLFAGAAAALLLMPCIGSS
jgi:hypothetical protein